MPLRSSAAGKPRTSPCRAMSLQPAGQLAQPASTIPGLYERVKQPSSPLAKKAIVSPTCELYVRVKKDDPGRDSAQEDRSTEETQKEPERSRPREQGRPSTPRGGGRGHRRRSPRGTASTRCPPPPAPPSPPRTPCTPGAPPSRRRGPGGRAGTPRPAQKNKATGFLE